VTLEIVPYTLEASPKHHIRTVAYNSQIPGPLSGCVREKRSLLRFGT
jgi:hypothetical protein